MKRKEVPNLRSQKKTIRRDTILEATRSLILEIGDEAMTMDMVADRAQVTKPTLYAYFDSKESLILEAYLRVLELSSELFLDIDAISSPIDKLSIIVRRALEINVLKATSRYSRPPSQVISHPKFAESMHRMRIYMAKIVEDGQSIGEIATDLDSFVIVQTFFCLAGSRNMERFVFIGQISREELIEQLHTYLIDSIRPIS